MGVVGRTLFYGRVKDQIVFYNMAVVHTTIGDMVEQRPEIVEGSNGIGPEAVDETMMITNLKEVNFGALGTAYPFADDGVVLHDLPSAPRSW